jgi:hypothetical protein
LRFDFLAQVHDVRIDGTRESREVVSERPRRQFLTTGNVARRASERCQQPEFRRGQHDLGIGDPYPASGQIDIEPTETELFAST